MAVTAGYQVSPRSDGSGWTQVGPYKERSEEVPLDQERRPRPLVPGAQVPDWDQEQERPEEQSEPLPPQQPRTR